MREDHIDMIDLYMERERLRYFHELELYKREILEDFFKRLVNGRRISDITVSDGREYYRHLLKLSGKSLSGYVYGKMRVLNSFMDFAVTVGWIEKNPWSDEFNFLNLKEY